MRWHASALLLLPPLVGVGYSRASTPQRQAVTPASVLPAVEAHCAPGPECLWRVAENARLPVIVEFPYNERPADRLPFAQAAMPLKAFLDEFVESNPAYEWRQVDGIFVVRPRMAWSSKESVLNREVKPFQFTAVTLPEWYPSLDTADGIRHFSNEMADPGDDVHRRVTLTFSGGSLLDAMTSVARAYDHNVAGKVEYRRVERLPHAAPRLEPQLTLDIFPPRK